MWDDRAVSFKLETSYVSIGEGYVFHSAEEGIK